MSRPENRAARMYEDGRRFQDNGDHDLAWKCYESAIAMYAKAGRQDYADELTAMCRADGYLPV